MKADGGVQVWRHAFLKSALYVGVVASYSGRATTNNHWRSGQVGRRTDLEAAETKRIPCPSRNSFSPLSTYYTAWPVMATPDFYILPHS